MLVSTLLLQAGLILLPCTSATPHVLARNTNASAVDVAQMAASATASAGLKAYVLPKQEVRDMLGIGDSFTSGIGSDGLPDYMTPSYDCARYKQAWPVQLANLPDWSDFNGDQPRLTFGACVGAKTFDVIGRQLEQGNPTNTEYTAIGKPQLAVMTVGGNNVGFSNIIFSCILHPFPFYEPCDKVLTDTENLIDSQDFAANILTAYVKVIIAGRKAGGASPPESFQLYVAEYPGFWNHDDPGCDEVYWSSFWSEAAYLTQPLRLRLNHLVDRLNRRLKGIATSLEGIGVFWVEGINPSFNEGRYCEPAPQDVLKNPTGGKTKFWAPGSGGWNSGSEGDPGSYSTTDVTQDWAQTLLNLTIPDENVRKTVSKTNPPWKVSDAWKSEASLLSALDNNYKAKNDTFSGLASQQVKRAFHPKGSAYAWYAQAFLQTIKAHRQPLNAQSASSSISSQSAPSTTSSSVPATTSSSAPPPPSPTPAFAQGTCTFHLIEWEDCGSDSSNLYADITMYDNNKAQIWTTPDQYAAADDLGMPINPGDNAFMRGPLPYGVSITGQHDGDLVQFAYGDVQWTSQTTNGIASCSSGAWDPKIGANCFDGGDTPAKRQMDCGFPC